MQQSWIFPYKNENDSNRKKCQTKTTGMALWWSFHSRKINLKKSRGTAKQLQSCLLAVVMKWCRIWPCHWLAPWHLPLQLYWFWKTEKKKKRDNTFPKICLICSHHLATSLVGESGHGAIWSGFADLHFWGIYYSLVVLKHTLPQCPTLLLALI